MCVGPGQDAGLDSDVVTRHIPRVLRVLCMLSVAAVPAQGQTPPDTTRSDTLPVELVPIVVSVTRTPETARRTPYAVSILEGDRIALARPAVALSEAIAFLPGVTVQNRHNAARDESISIRGFGARSAFGIRGVRVLLDGIPQTLPDGQGQLTNVDLAELERIEVLRGAASALYGNAAGGVVNLVTRSGATDRVRPAGSVLVGSHGLLSARTGAAGMIGGSALTLGASRTSSTGFREQSRSETWRASVRGMHPVGTAARITTAFHVARQPLAEDPGALTAAEIETDPGIANPAHLANDAGKTVTQAQLGAAILREGGGGVRVEAAVFGLMRELDNPLPFAIINLSRRAGGARVLASMPLGSGSSLEPVLTIGADAQWQRDDRVNRSPQTGDVTRDQLEWVREAGPFAQFRLSPLDRLTLTTGFRYDMVRFEAQDRLLADGDDSGVRTMAAISPFGGIALDLTRTWTWFASAGSAFETPTTTELVNRPTGAGGFNPELDPQRATHYETGMRGSGSGWSMELSAFRVDVRDALIPFEVPGDPGRRFFRNAGRTRHEGIEAAVGLSPLPWVRIHAAYTFANNRFRDFTTAAGTFNGNRIPGVPVHNLAGSVILDAGGWRLALEGRHTGRLYVNDANSAENSAWSVFDVRLSRAFLNATVLPYAAVQNMFDRSYAGAVSVNAAQGRFYEPAPRRTFLIGISARRAQRQL